MAIRLTYETTKPDFKRGEMNPNRNRSYRSMGKPKTTGEMHAREALQHNDDWPTRRRNGYLSFAKRQATVSDRRASKRLLRDAELMFE